MKNKKGVAIGITVALLLTAATLVFQAYQRYQANPWTRDGQVQADVVLIRAQVSGNVSAVHVKNNALVQAGELLFEVDSRALRVALEQAQADQALAQVRMQELEAELQSALSAAHPTLPKGGAGRGGLSSASPSASALSTPFLDEARNSVNRAKATYGVAAARTAQARLSLEQCRVLAPVTGYVTNINLRPGSEVAALAPLFALIDTSTYRVTGFFQETDLSRIAPGQAALVTLMGYPESPLHGVVESIDWGIAQSNGSVGANMLPAVKPTFEWIRLAQRVPVNVRLVDASPSIPLRVGTTASVLMVGHTN